MRIFDFNKMTFEEQVAALEAQALQLEQEHGAPHWKAEKNNDIRKRALETIFDRLEQYECGEAGTELFGGYVRMAQILGAITPLEELVLLAHYMDYTIPTYQKLMAEWDAEDAKSMEEYEKNE